MLFFQPDPSSPLSPSKVFTFLFVMIGPLKVIGPFAKMTAGWERHRKRRLAFQAILIAAFGALAAVTLGARLLQKWGVSLGALLLTAGLVLFLVALDVVMRQYSSSPENTEEHATPPAGSSSPRPSVRALAFSLAFPTIITPYGAAVLILLVSLRAGQPAVIAQIIGLVALVLVLDLVAMLTADRIMTTPAVRPALGILAIVLSILQVALGVQAMIDALYLLGMPKLASG